jgi:ActR/RegA family two-component response regulator
MSDNGNYAKQCSNPPQRAKTLCGGGDRERVAISRTQYWADAAEDLRLSVDAPFSVAIPTGESFEFIARLRYFGAENGMLLLSDYGAIATHSEALVALGYGYSTLSDPCEPYEREMCLELLRDWGWSGPAQDTPDWL